MSPFKSPRSSFPSDDPDKQPLTGLRQQLYEIIFEADTPNGKAFDVALLIVIAISVVSITLETVASLSQAYANWFQWIEWIVTAFFSVEYLLRLYCAPKRTRYIFSFFGIIDLLSLLPTYLAYFIVGIQYLTVIRIFRLLRIFRILKLARFMDQSNILINALQASKEKILVFLFAVSILVILIGSLMYVIEGPENGFTSIPTSIYWCIVTLTTVGFGDITPHTTLGKIFASIVMLLGYGIIAVPTGIVSSELNELNRNKPD